MPSSERTPSSDRLAPAVRRRAAGPLAAALAAIALVVAGCGATTPPSVPASGQPLGTTAATPGAPSASPAAVGVASGTSSDPSATPPPRGSTAGAAVTATLLGVRLPSPVSRAVVAADGGAVLVIGGLGASGTTGAILRLDPSAGAVTRAGRLASPVHDAAGAPLGGAWLVLGGGRTVAVTSVQRVTPGGAAATAPVVGSLPAARADGAAVAAGGRVLLVGGGRGGVPDSSVLATRDGVHFTRLGRLAVPVRYGAVAAVGDAVYVFGGSAASGDSDAIQRIDVATGAVTVVGRLPAAVSEATAFVLGGRLLIAGGMRAGRPTSAILAYDPVSGRTRAAGRLPVALADAGAAVVGSTAYLVGGETGRAYLSSVIAVR